MNRAAAWNVRGVGHETRNAAQEAARRAGMSLGEWLDDVIAEQAAEQGVDPKDLNQEERLDAISQRLSGLPRREDINARRARREAEGENSPAVAEADAAGEAARAEELLDAAIGRFESRAAKSEARTARALDSVATWIERNQTRQRDENDALRAVVGRLASLEERITGQQPAHVAPASRPAARTEPAQDGPRDLVERVNDLSRRLEASDKGSRDAPRPARPRLDIADAVSQIARRRQELDARVVIGEAEPAKRGWTNFGIDPPPAARSAEPAPSARDVAIQTVMKQAAAKENAAGALQAEIAKLSQRLDELRREHSEKREAPAANIEGLRAELAAMSRSLADLAPRNAVVALEGAIRDLSQRVAASRENGARDNLIAPVEGLVAELRDSLRAHDPRQAVEALQREIGAIGAKVDGIARTSINPLALERIRQQTEEARALLTTLAQRPMPLDRLEKQIGDLADRVDRLPTSLAPRAESAQLVASLAEARAQVERSTPASALASIERRLEQIAARMDQAVERPPPAPINPRALEDLSRRIDGVRESIESRYAAAPAAALDTSALEQAMREISAKLDRPSAASAVNPRALEDLSRRIDGVRESIETRYAGAPTAALDANALEQAMREISAKLDRPSAASIDRAAFESMIDDLGARIDRRTNPIIDTGPLEQVLRRLGDRPVAVDTRPLEGLMREISVKLEGAHAAPPNAELLESLRDINAKLEGAHAALPGAELLESLRDINANLEGARAAAPDADRLERLLRDISLKLDGARAAAPDADLLERLLRDISVKIEGARAAAPDARLLERLLRDIGAKLDETRPALDADLLERLLHDISAKLDSPRGAPDSDLLERLLRDINVKLDGARAAAPDTDLLERLLRDISAKLDGARAAAAHDDVLEGLLRDINVKLDRPAPPTIEPAALEGMIRDLAARIDRRTNPIIDTRALEQTLRSLQDKIELSASPQFAAERIDQAVQILSERFAAKTAAAPDISAIEDLIRGLEQKFENAHVGGSDPHALEALADDIANVRRRLDAPQPDAPSIDALERMVAQLLPQLDQTRQALSAVSAPSGDEAAGDHALALKLAELRAEQNNADHRMQATLGGVHHMLESLVDRIGQIEDDIARTDRAPAPPASAAPSRSPAPPASSVGPASAALNWMDATIRETPAPAPARPAPEPRADDRPDAAAPRVAAAASAPMRSLDGSDFLIEPGAGAPLRAVEKDPIAGADPRSAVNAHIAAARRAAQAALAETASNVAKPSPGEGAASAGVTGIQQAKAFIAARRRPLLLGAALVALLAIAAVELGVLRQPNIQRSDIESAAARLASAEPAAPTEAPAPAKTETRAIDTTPVGSISAATSGSAPAKFLIPAPAELVAAIPGVTPQALHDAAAAGDPTAQFELASRLVDGRNMPRDVRAGAQWLERAASQGFAPAQYRFGSLYEKGVGVPRDLTLARSWYKKAADAGNARAMHNLAVLSAEGAGVKPDYSEAADWFRKAGRLGVRDSQYNLGILYARGMGIAQDLSQSWFWFSLAAKQGDADAAKKRDEVAAKMDAAALTADAAALADFHPATPNPAANDVPAPPGGWDFNKMAAPQPAPAQPTQPQATGAPAAAAHSAPM
jgi:localization factor PodJL